MAAGREQLFLEQVGNCRLARAGETGEPEHRRTLVLQVGAAALADIERLPVDVFGASQRMQDHAGANGGVCDAVDQDEGAGRAVLGEGIEGDRGPRREVADADLVEVERLRRLMREIVDVDPVFQIGDGGAHLVGLGAQDIGAAGQQRLLIEPDDVGGELIGDLRTCGRRHQHVAARHFDLVVKDERDGLAGDGLLEVAAMRDDALDARGPARLGDHDLVSFRNRARGDGTGKAAEIEVRAVHILDGKAERQLDGGFVDRHGFQMLDQRRAGIPGRALGTAGDIVAIARRHRDLHDAGEA